MGTIDETPALLNCSNSNADESITHTSSDTTVMKNRPELKYILQSESDIKKIETARNTFEKILNQRKEDYLNFTHEYVAKYSNKKKKTKGKDAKSPKKDNIKSEYLILNVKNMHTQLTKLKHNLYREQCNRIGKARKCTYYEDYNAKAQRLLDDKNSTLDTKNKKSNDMTTAYKAQLKTILSPLAKANKALKDSTKNQLDEFRRFKQSARIVSVVKCDDLDLSDFYTISFLLSPTCGGNLRDNAFSTYNRWVKKYFNASTSDLSGYQFTEYCREFECLAKLHKLNDVARDKHSEKQTKISAKQINKRKTTKKTRTS